MPKELFWIEDLLPQETECRRMFGGFAYYVDEKLMLLIFESTGNKSYHGHSFGFEIWNGCMFPVEKEVQQKVLKSYPYLHSHPVLPKWLYLPAETEDFETLVLPLLREIRRKNELFGSIPTKKKANLRKNKFNDWDVDPKEVGDTSRPKMFADESEEKVFQRAKRISDLKNLGPETEKAFIKAGIKTPQQFQKLGWKKTMEILVKANPKADHSILAYAVIGALENKIWNGISENLKKEARDFMKTMRIASKTKTKVKSNTNQKPPRQSKRHTKAKKPNQSRENTQPKKKFSSDKEQASKKKQAQTKL